MATESESPHEPLANSLAESERRIGAPADAAPIGIFQTTRQGELLCANPVLASMLGYGSPEEMRGLSAGQLYAQPGSHQALLASLEAGKPVSGLELDLRTRQGSVRTMLISASLRGSLLEAVAVDVTAQKLAERRVRDENRFLRSVIESLPNPFVVINVNDYKVEFANPAARRAGIEEHQFCYLAHRTGMPCREPAHVCPIQEMKNEGKPVVVEHVHYDITGNRRHVQIFAYPVIDSGGNLTHIIEHSVDITERKQAEEKLRQANEKLARLNQLKDEFLSMASHELKTPITSIKIFSELAARNPGKLEPRFMASLTRQADQLAAMINDLLDVSRLQLDRVRLELELCDLWEVLAEICDLSRHLYADHPLRCEPPPEPILVRADRSRLAQVLQNLIDNAAKYSPAGRRIWLEVGRRSGEALVAVRDEGIGIAPEHLPHIFERFYKPGPQQSVYSGLGVGLYISKEIVERHGGRIWAESEEGKGSTFYVELPLASQSATETEDAAPS